MSEGLVGFVRSWVVRLVPWWLLGKGELKRERQREGTGHRHILLHSLFYFCSFAVVTDAVLCFRCCGLLGRTWIHELDYVIDYASCAF